MAGHRYEVALSFAGEQREFVGGVASYLLDQGIAVFYDDFERLRLVGENLESQLTSIYSTESGYIVLFISEAYAKKPWTTYEREAALNACQGEYSRLLAVKFDETQLPVLSPSLASVDARRLTPEEIGYIILAKLSNLHPPTKTIASFVAWRLSRRSQAALAFLPQRFAGAHWSSPQTPVVYAAGTLCGALLEVCRFINDSSGHDFVAVGARISTRDPITELTPTHLPAGWRGDSEVEALRTLGNSMITGGRVPAIAVPAPILLHERLYLINPLHRDFGSIVIIAEQPLDLRRLGARELPLTLEEK